MPPEDHEWDPDDELYWREEAFGEHPVLNPWGDPHKVIQIAPNSD
jgi:hypothetical protein